MEVQKLAWFLERNVEMQNLPSILGFQFEANIYGPFSDRLRHLLNALDGTYLHCSRRLADASARDVIWFEDQQAERVALFLKTKAKPYLEALEATNRPDQRI